MNMKILLTKKQHKLAQRVVENYMIARSALNESFTDDKKEIKTYASIVDRLVKNTVDSLYDLVGMRGLMYYTKLYNLDGSTNESNESERNNNNLSEN